MTNIIGAVYNSTQLTYCKKEKCFVGEISEIPKVLRQLWNDSLDIGFGIRSAKTDNVAFFTLVEISNNGEGETLFWVFEPTDKSIAANPALLAHKVFIYND